MLNRIAASKQEDLKLYGHKIMDDYAHCPTLPAVRDFFGRLAGNDRVGLIAEVKKASPSRGLLLADFNPVRLAVTYQENGAGVVSVITEERFFLGNPRFIADIKESVQIPVLRKDFIIDERQLYETRLLQADAVLLITRLVGGRLLYLVELARELGLEPLVEVHDREEIKRALDTPVRVIGINNRDLQNFSVKIQTCLDLAEMIPPQLARIAESGIFTAADMLALEARGFRAALVGEALVTAADIAVKTRELVQYKEFENDQD
ncbi:MAG: indole-3-glycerol phosphate synthase TrpC [Syntrophomonadaceae bacterium]|nr:indole-3-glycerol phosphate synthase TrpC [Syntrophomonadaceae bacterium]